ncbi:MAG: 50S ribosomal protein L25 [Saprospiraceae bacterium]
MEIFSLKGELRKGSGKKQAKADRSNGLIPCVIYGGENLLNFVVEPKDVKHLIYTPKFQTVNLEVDGKSYNSILKDIQFHPVSDEIIHIDFQELVNGRNIKVAVPVKFVGASKGVKEGGALSPLMRKVTIKTKPENLVDELEADVSSLGLGQSLRVKSLKLPEGVEAVQDPNTPIAYIEIPRSLKSAKDAASKEGGNK